MSRCSTSSVEVRRTCGIRRARSLNMAKATAVEPYQDKNRYRVPRWLSTKHSSNLAAQYVN